MQGFTQYIAAEDRFASPSLDASVFEADLDRGPVIHCEVTIRPPTSLDEQLAGGVQVDFAPGELARLTRPRSW